MRPLHRFLPLLALAGSVVTAAPSGTAAERPLLPSPAWYRPVVEAGFTFPVARANWLPIIEFSNDWHDPRFRFVGGRWRLVGVHEGTDILAEKGTPVLAATAGTVEAVGWTFYSGTRVGVRGHDGKYYFYAHLSEVAPGITLGASIEAGEVLGLVGNTGYGPPEHEDEFFPHLHFGIEGPGGWENPFPLLRSLYRGSVAATAAGEERLAEAGLDGREGEFDRVAGRLYGSLWDG